MKKLAAVVFLLGAWLVLAGEAQAQQQFWGVVDGNPPTPVRVQGNGTVTVTRLGVGSYRLNFPGPVRFFLGTSQTIGPAGDSTPTLLSSKGDSANPRIVYVQIYAISNGGAPDTTELTPANAFFSYEARRQ